MKTAIFALLAASAAAFTPVVNKATSTALQASAYENELGVISPTGFWDPAKISFGKDRATFDRYRATELKHGRVAMLAVCGYVVPEFYRFGFEIAPGLPCADVPNGIAALKAIPFFGIIQIIGLIGVVEKTGYLGDFDMGKPDLGPQVLAKRQLQELQHGRLAMLGILELIRHDLSGGADGMDNLITGLPFLYN